MNVGKLLGEPLYELRDYPKCKRSVIYSSRNKGPGVVLLHGSEGDVAPWIRLRAAFLAAHGYHALALASWPNDLQNIELGGTFDALQWLKEQPFTKGHQVGLWGGSRGAEQALIVAWLSTKFPSKPKPAAVAVHSPSDCIMPGWPDQSKHAWMFDKSHQLVETWRPIPIEEYEGPVFITHGEDDQTWSVTQTRRIEARLNQAQRAHGDEVIYYPKEGHILGTESFNDCNRRLLKFFNRHLWRPRRPYHRHSDTKRTRDH